MPVAHPQSSGRPVENSSTTPLKPDIAHQVREYRRERLRRTRRRRVQEAISQNANREIGEIVELARIWAPYGGAPADVVFQSFGISLNQFAARLWDAVYRLGCDSSLMSELDAVYPRQ
jgi:hypothetical protein